MKAEKLIQHFNRINGNALNLSTAKALHADVQKALDHDSHGPYAKPLREVQSKLAKFMKMCTEQNVIGTDQLYFEPVQYHPGMGLKEIIQVGRKELGKPVGSLSGTEVMDKYGIIISTKAKANKFSELIVEKYGIKVISKIEKGYLIMEGETLQSASTLLKAFRRHEPTVSIKPGSTSKFIITVPIKSKINAKPEKADETMLHGLQCIQKDADYQGQPLGAIGDTTYKVITDKILSLIKKDGLIWRKPWNAHHAGKESHAHNYVTKTYYRGANFYLNYLLMSDFESPYFFTYRQVDQLGGKVKAGSKGWPVIYFKWLYKKQGGALVEETEATANGKLKSGYEKFPALFYYTVFNHEQTEGVKVKPFKKATLTLKEKIESCETIVANMPQRPPIKNVSGDRAFYVPSADSITMPLMEQFKQEQEYYCTLFHELIHSTGHYERLQRDLTGKFGSKNYAFEELIAELGASFLCGESGIFYFTMNNSAAYIKGWSKKLVEQLTADNKFFVKAAAAAEKASEFILDRANADKKKKPAKKLKVGRYTKPATANRNPVKKKSSTIPTEVQPGKEPFLLYWNKLNAEGDKKTITVIRALWGRAFDVWNLEKKNDEIAARLLKSEYPFKVETVASVLSDYAPKDKQFAGIVKKSKTKTATRNQQPVTKSLNGFLSADQTPATPANTFVLPGPMGMLGQLQRFKLQIVIPGETHSSKSQLGMQLANAFAAMGDDVAWIDWEQGGLQSKDTQLMISRNTDPENKKRIHVNGNLPRTLEAVKDLTKQYKVIALDSGTKLKGQKTNEWIDELREEFPEVVWIIMMQQNAQGGTRGGSAAEYDAPVVLKTYRPDHSDFRKNYATVFKNRGNATGFNYFINLKQLEQQPQAA